MSFDLGERWTVCGLEREQLADEVDDIGAQVGVALKTNGVKCLGLRVVGGCRFQARVVRTIAVQHLKSKTPKVQMSTCNSLVFSLP